MPYEIDIQNGKHCVVKQGSGEVVHCHATHEQAMAQMRALYANEPMAQKESGLAIFKDHTGSWRWVSVSSTAYEDSDQEIIATKALEDDVARADADGQYGPLLWWHDPGIVLGECDFNAMHGRCLIESGTFVSEAVGQSLGAVAPTLKMSIGFYERGLDESRVYHYIRRIERSALPAENASNQFTSFFAIQETSMLDGKFKDFVDRVFGGDTARAEAALAQAEAHEKAAQDAGVRFKEEGTAAMEASPEQVPLETATPPAAQEALSRQDIEGIVGQIVPLLALAVAEHVAPMVKELAAGIAQKEHAAAANQETLKSAQEKQAADVARLQQTLATQQAALQGTQAKLKELLGEQPRQAGYRASQDADTVIGEGHALKGASPAPDPLAAHMNGILSALGGTPGE